MSDLKAVRSLYAYHFDTTNRLISAAAELSEEAIHEQPGYGRGAIHDVLFHVLATDRSWRIGLETGSRPQPLDADSYPDLSALRKGFEREKEAWSEYIDSLEESGIDGEVELTAGQGRSMTVGRWKVLHHVVLHGMQHHAELSQMLTRQGQSPGDIDYIFYRFR